MAKTRTFVGIRLDDDAIGAVTRIANRVRPHADQLRWVQEENLHVTLQFLGDLSDMEVVEVCREVEHATARLSSFSIEVGGLGAFPSVDRPRALWVGVTPGEGRDSLVALQAEVADTLAQIGHRGENRPYVPHITIGKAGNAPGGRLQQLTAKLIELAPIAANTTGNSVVAGVTVFSSELLREGPEYHVLATCSLLG